MSEVTRRDALKLIVATGAAAAAGCTDDAASAAPSAPNTPKENASMPHDEVKRPDPVLAIEPLTMPWQTLDPFLFCVHHDDRYPRGNPQMGPLASLAGRDIGQDFAGKDGWNMYHGEVVPGFPQHPHRGFETVTVVRRGLLDHSDSMGATARYGKGDVQWLTAGRGIQHAEMFPLLSEAVANPLELFQIWLNLPRSNKMVEPHFSMLWADSIPVLTERDAKGRTTVLTLDAGRYRETQAPAPPPNSWAADPKSDIAIWTLKLEPSAQFTLPRTEATTHRALYFFAGRELRIDGRAIAPKQFVRVRAEVDLALEAGADGAELLMLQGRPIGEPVVKYGPFVMNTEQEIRQAFIDYRSTQFGGWPWDKNDPVHPREEGRFARRPDGSTERPA